MNPKSQEEKFYEIADRAMFGLQMALHPVQLAAIAMVEDYGQVDGELAKLEEYIENFKIEFQKRAEALMETRHNG